jgi:hypothetical protein
MLRGDVIAVGARRQNGVLAPAALVDKLTVCVAVAALSVRQPPAETESHRQASSRIAFLSHADLRTFREWPHE